MENIKIYLICGKARNGKNTASKILKEELESKNNKVCEIQIMRTLKGYLKDYFNWDGQEDTKPRKLLQRLGTELIRIDMNMPNFHIDRLTEDIKVLSNFYNVFIVNDIRLPEEIETLKERFKDVVSINIIKKDYVSPLDDIEEKHVTEHALEDYKKFDYILINDELDKLKCDIIKIVDREVEK